MLWSLPLFLLRVFAQVAQAQTALPDTPAGWAGWASFLTSGGVLTWLLFVHLPNKDKQQEKMVQANFDHVAQLTKDHKEAVEKLAAENKASLAEERKAFQEGLKQVIDHAREESRFSITLFSRDLESIEKTLERLNGTIEQVASSKIKANQ